MWMDDGALLTISLVSLWALVAALREASTRMGKE